MFSGKDRSFIWTSRRGKTQVFLCACRLCCHNSQNGKPGEHLGKEEVLKMVLESSTGLDQTWQVEAQFLARWMDIQGVPQPGHENC